MKRHAVIAGGLVVLIVIAFGACERQGPPKPVGSATNKHVEESPATPSNAPASPMGQAHQVEGVLQDAAQARGKQAEEAAP